MQSNFSYHPLSLAVQSVCCALPLSFVLSGVAYAQTAEKNNEATTGEGFSAVQLDALQVVVNKKPSRYETDVSGLSKIVKSQEELTRQQVMDIRDMVKYDAGVSVVEQGRGGSSGYSIYGVDKNRVAVTVDGVAQAQSYVDETTNSGNTGSMNEVEIANVAAVEISKGSSGVSAGSGGLGGAVEFTTKKASHVIPAGKNHVIKSQSAYTSKDKRFSQTIAGALQGDKFAGLIQYTKRKGEGTQAHKDAGNLTHTFTRLSSFEEKYDLRSKDKPYDTFRFEGCNNDDCVMYFLKPTKKADAISLGGRSLDELSAEEKAQYDNMLHKTETVLAKDYAGFERVLPNPMDYESDSYLGNFSFTPNDKHHFGLILEDTRQRYDSRDMTYCSYLPLSKKDRCDTKMAFPSAYGFIYLSDMPTAKATEQTGVHQKGETILPSLRYTRIKLLDEAHKKQRLGLSHEYTGSLFDKVTTNLTYQAIKQDTATIKKGCSLYPTVDKDCQVSQDKAGSFSINESAHYGEKSLLGTINFEKMWSALGAEHNTKLLAGVGTNQATYYRTNITTQARHLADNTGTRDDDGVAIYKDLGVKIFEKDICFNKTNCLRQPIKLNNAFIGVSNIAHWNKLSLSGSARFDANSVKSDDKAVRNNTYKNSSFGAGLNYAVNDDFSLLAKISTGFRVPSFQELYGFDGIQGNERGGKYHYIQNLKPETSTSRELGIRFNNGVWDLEGSIFKSNYRNLIAQATLCKPNADCRDFQNQQTGYHNAQNADLKGINLRGRVDLNAIDDSMPEGLFAFGSYSHVNADRLFLNAGHWHTVESYPLEAVQPGRFVYGLSYDNPNEKWGATATWIYSKSKNPEELAFRRVAFGGGYDKETSKITTKPWMTLDVSGYYHFNDNISLRASVNNILNYRYTTWESARQSSSKGLSAENNVGYSPNRYAAPGRNFAVGLEMTF